ncbi:hypothetical protein CHELA1G11_20429 [Hyphomicrobiales bacterium]|nr:hypothetical protein CHELA1G11_20429 [Hyphomicrobiales bacterium]CAH1690170.1 hypothetical protein CHELA1G2_20742 [Hyphomicrobiales bacterium]
MPSRIYPFEEMSVSTGSPSLLYCRDGKRDLPLIVLVTGGGVLARISYGHPEGREQDFLAYWLRSAGYPFLALSYPLGNPVFPTVHPDFSVQDWGEQVAESIAKVVNAKQLPRDVVILAWSMAGRIAVPLVTALKRRGCDIELFVAMAASPPLAFVPPLEHLQPASDGLANVSGPFTHWLVRSLAEQGERAGRALIPEAVFRREFTGNIPVNLVASSLRWRAGSFVSDLSADLADTRALEYEAYPPTAVITHDDAGDSRHALTDTAAWACSINQSLCARHLFAHQDRIAGLPAEAWHHLLGRVRSATDDLSTVMAGNHMFFLGEDSARATIAALEKLRRSSNDLRSGLTKLLAD